MDGGEALLRRELDRLNVAIENLNRSFHVPLPLAVIWTRDPNYIQDKSYERITAEILATDGRVYEVEGFFYADPRRDRAWLIGPGREFPGPMDYP